jgi:hypothetical protein
MTREKNGGEAIHGENCHGGCSKAKRERKWRLEEGKE